MSNQILQQQIAYYRARANEYDQWFYRIGRYDRGNELNRRWFKEVGIVKQGLQQIGQADKILELACGTGIWTQELLKIGQKITAIDASEEVIEINRRKLNSPKVEYHQIDLFAWEPQAEYDLVFFSFWLSHVPPELLKPFLLKVYKSVRVGGRLFIVDSRFEPTSTANNHILNDDGSIYKNRKLNDGQEFQIVKVFYQQDELQKHLTQVGFKSDVKVTDHYFIYANNTKFYN
ncbi:class I SAM-dependent methyltransferase [Trichormus variabilis ARAD]|nr:MULTISPECIES: class I SAM-dependent methyltransferase [Nostocaceae]MBC1213834.1 class I SAM-dependent methyltransferase [Trichormus variabilis ARAD]MBC1258793.1 class I SAM-dependent methyltransferase [Trichormus variabilis V5]MBC1266443.1 class I SAM-dependent methyltransferase [Trichormus variabilis FSR]MBC1302601.1 class I SAM-dependent methyltransferase [Trichormus variabilis N2B]MBC1312671.1 class I SAM-dependent methyltransferase [Trichormus variabilis PNB]